MSNSPTAVPNDDVFEEDTCEEEVEDLIGEHTDQVSFLFMYGTTFLLALGHQRGRT